MGCETAATESGSQASHKGFDKLVLHKLARPSGYKLNVARLGHQYSRRGYILGFLCR